MSKAWVWHDCCIAWMQCVLIKLLLYWALKWLVYHNFTYSFLRLVLLTRLSVQELRLGCKELLYEDLNFLLTRNFPPFQAPGFLYICLSPKINGTRTTLNTVISGIYFLGFTERFHFPQRRFPGRLPVSKVTRRQPGISRPYPIPVIWGTCRVLRWCRCTMRQGLHGGVNCI